jgi:hypothetical protein
MLRHASELPTAYRPLRRRNIVPAEFHVVLMWSAFGLALTGLFFAMGFGPAIGQALMAAG